MDDKTDMAQGNRRNKIQNCRHYLTNLIETMKLLESQIA